MSGGNHRQQPPQIPMTAKKPNVAAKKAEDWVAQTIRDAVDEFVNSLLCDGVHMTDHAADQLVDWICDRAKVVVE